MDIRTRTEQLINGQSVTNRQLQTLLAVARTGSMTAAAKELLK